MNGYTKRCKKVSGFWLELRRGDLKLAGGVHATSGSETTPCACRTLALATFVDQGALLEQRYFAAVVPVHVRQEFSQVVADSIESHFVPFPGVI